MRFSVSVCSTTVLLLILPNILPASSGDCDLHFRTTVYQGDPLTVYLYPASKDAEVSVELRDRSGRIAANARPFAVRLTEDLSAEAAILAIPVSLAPGEYTLQAVNDSGVLIRKTVTIFERPYPEERIALNGEMTKLRSVHDPKKDKESEYLYSLLVHFDPDSIYQTGKFSPPVTGYPVSSSFGSRRVYSYSTGGTSTTYHYGTDFAVPVGIPIGASGNGKVVFSGMRILTGNSVVVEHLPSVYSIYYHLDSLSVQTGDAVETGDLLGYSGKTGLVTGPHLHFEFRVAGSAVEPAALLNGVLIDKDFIISIIHADKTLEKGR